MPTRLDKVRVRNFRCLKHVDVALSPINVLFGPNGSGKSSFLDAIWFIHDCAIHGTEKTFADRHYGIGMLWDGAESGDRIEIALQTGQVEYTVSFGYSAGHVEPFVGERLRSLATDNVLIDRKIGSDNTNFCFHSEGRNQSTTVKLREPEKLAFVNYLLLCAPMSETEPLDNVFRSIHLYGSRAGDFQQLRRFGSESNQHTVVNDRWQNLWSALRNLQGRQAVDQRYATIVEFMRAGFPDSFRDFVFEQIGTDWVSASFVEVGRRQPIQASGVSDGHLQLLGLLASLFGEDSQRHQVLMFDDPEISLHPHAISVFARAVERARTEFNRQVIIATHSPVLMSQFASDSCLVFRAGDERDTQVEPLANRADLHDLLDEYALGSLYMAEAVAGQRHGDDPIVRERGANN